MSKPKFKKGDIVLYQNGNTFKLGLVKSVLNTNTRVNNSNYKYHIYYHMEAAPAITDECNLHPINNAYAFTIIKKSTEPDIQVSPARQLANKILSYFHFYGQCYYDLEDWLTQIIEDGDWHRLPNIESEYLKCALRVEVRDYFDANNAINVKSEDIENVINELFKSFSQNVLNTDFIWDTVRDYIDTNNIKCKDISYHPCGDCIYYGDCKNKPEDCEYSDAYIKKESNNV